MSMKFFVGMLGRHWKVWGCSYIILFVFILKAIFWLSCGKKGKG